MFCLYEISPITRIFKITTKHNKILLQTKINYKQILVMDL